MLEETNRLAGIYGIRNKRELWRAAYLAKRYRRLVRKYLAVGPEEAERKLRPVMERLRRLGVLGEDATVDSLLDLTAEDFLKRRLQTLVWQKGFARTPYQARQFVVHGHIYVAGRRIRQPGYLVRSDEEDLIECRHPSCLSEGGESTESGQETPEGVVGGEIENVAAEER